ncbi:MAG: hypothetical protein LBJ00_12455 [Planctomycetaceae bacterium]|nr:hypothetical protein [Planctomycetaceae bacterium]
MLLRLPNALRCRFTATSGILKQLQYSIFLLKTTSAYTFEQRNNKE